jgi:hypothetical protein
MARKKISTNPLIRSTRAQELKNRLEWVFDENKIKREQIKKERAANKSKTSRKAFKVASIEGGEFDENGFESPSSK